MISSEVGLAHVYARQYDQAIEECRKTLEMERNFLLAHLFLGISYAQKGAYQEAIAEDLVAVSGSGRDPFMLSVLGHAYGASGNGAAARAIIEELQRASRSRYISPFSIAQIYIGLAEKDRAFEWLERAYQERTSYLVVLNVYPVFDALRSDARFADLLQRIGLR